MREADRTHPGGVAAPHQPYDEVPQAGKINFNRLVQQNREQSEPEDGVITAKNTTTTEEVQGHKYTWASNISHHGDTGVRVEDLSHIDINPQVERKTLDLLHETLKGDDEGKNTHSRSHIPGGRVITEQFTAPGPFGDLRICRKTFLDSDVPKKDNRQYARSATAKRISEEARKQAGPAPSGAQEKHVACRILAGNNHTPPAGAKRDKGPKLLRQAQEELYFHLMDASYESDLANEMNEAKPSRCTIAQQDIDWVEKNLPKSSQNPFDQYRVDREAAKACEHLENFDITICRDKNHELILGVFTEAIQKLFPAGTLEKMIRASKAAAWRLPIKQPDELRHPTNQAIHLAQYPDKDVNSKDCEQPHFAVCGVEHYGVHHETGCSRGLARLCFQEFHAKHVHCSAVVKSSAWKEEFDKLKHGVYGLATKAWDPKLYRQYLEVRDNLPDVLQLTLAKTGDNPYGFLAHLMDPLTEGHTDSKDWEQGLAALTCFGDFTGNAGGNLVVKELGLDIPFPSGSCCLLRGHELHHQITSYEGNRHSIVLTNKDSVRRTVPDFQNGFKEKMDQVAELQLKDPKNWSADETRLHEAAMNGKSAVLELMWRSAREKRQTPKPQEDDPDQPPSKKQKTSKSE